MPADLAASDNRAPGHNEEVRQHARGGRAANKKKRRRGDIVLRNGRLFETYAVVVQHKSSNRRDKRQKATLRSLRLRGIDSKSLVYVDRAVLGMLQAVRPWTHLYPTSLPPAPPAELLQALRGTAMTPETYMSSGGTSEYRSYLTGEEAQIELHRRSFTVVWSAALPAKSFLHHVRPLISGPAITARISTADRQAIKCSALGLFDRVRSAPTSLSFIRLDLPDRSLTWEAANLGRALGKHPYLPGHVGVIAKQIEPEWLQQLIVKTATPHVAADADALLDAAMRLTKDFTSDETDLEGEDIVDDDDAAEEIHAGETVSADEEITVDDDLLTDGA